MRVPLFAATTACIASFALGAAAPAVLDGPVETRADGKVELGEDFTSAHEVELGKRLKATAKLYEQEFFGKEIVNAQLDLENPTDAPVFATFHIAFFDKQDNLLGAASQSTFEGLAAGESTSLGSLLVSLPHGEREKVAKFACVLYEDDEEIGTR
jgi:hypothetical protein